MTKQERCPKCGSSNKNFRFYAGDPAYRCRHPWHAQGQPEQSVEQIAREWLERKHSSKTRLHVFTRTQVAIWLAEFHTYMQGKE